MEYRILGKTGLKVGTVGLGTEFLDKKPYNIVEETIHTAMEHGVNFMDNFLPGEQNRINVGKAIAGHRDKWIIQGHLCCTELDKNNQFDITRDLDICKRFWDDYFKFMDIDYVDIGNLFFMDTEEDYKAVFESEFIEYVLKEKERGRIRYIGASSHNAKIAKRMIETGLLDVLMFSINPGYDMLPTEMPLGQAIRQVTTEVKKNQGVQPERKTLYDLCASREIGLVAMKVLGAGKLLSPEFTPFHRPLTVGQCIHYALDRPAVSTVVIGYECREHVLDAVNYFNQSDDERDYTDAISEYHNNFMGQCVYCNHCLPCPSEIDIAAVHRYLDIARLKPREIPHGVRHHYAALKNHASNCIECGSCENKCPFGVKVIGNMREAVELFGN